MKVIFLDIRGTLSVGKDTEYDLVVLTQSCLDAFAKLYAQVSGAKVVITSTFRNIPSAFGRICSYLRRSGVDIDFIDRTPSLGERSEEIYAWLRANPGVESFAVIDDEWVPQCTDHLVRVDYNVGLTEEHIPRVLQTLSYPNR